MLSVPVTENEDDDDDLPQDTEHFWIQQAVVENDVDTAEVDQQMRFDDNLDGTAYLTEEEIVNCYTASRRIQQ